MRRDDGEADGNLFKTESELRVKFEIGQYFLVTPRVWVFFRAKSPAKTPDRPGAKRVRFSSSNARQVLVEYVRGMDSFCPRSIGADSNSKGQMLHYACDCRVDRQYNTLPMSMLPKLIRGVGTCIRRRGSHASVAGCQAAYILSMGCGIQQCPKVCATEIFAGQAYSMRRPKDSGANPYCDKIDESRFVGNRTAIFTSSRLEQYPQAD